MIKLNYQTNTNKLVTLWAITDKLRIPLKFKKKMVNLNHFLYCLYDRLLSELDDI